MEIRIRKALPDDLAELSRLGTELVKSDLRFDPLLKKDWYTGEYGKKYLLGRIKGRNKTCLVAELKGGVIGYITASIQEPKTWRPIKVAELENLIVSKTHRGKGAGHKLVLAFLEWSRKRGAERVELEAEYLNKEALVFYEKIGFKLKHVKMEQGL